jgi:hypothetical protein
LVVANLGDNNVSVLLGNGDGTFQDQVTFSTGTAPRFLAATEISGDGLPDLLVANEGGPSLSVMLNRRAAALVVTTTSLVASPNPSVFGAPVQLTASVLPDTVSGTVDFKEKDDLACLERIRSLVARARGIEGSRDQGIEGSRDRGATQVAPRSGRPKA